MSGIEIKTSEQVRRSVRLFMSVLAHQVSC
jgi:hypothetical protein